MNVTFKIKDMAQLANLVGIHITSWRLMYGYEPFTGDYSNWSASPGPTGPDQSQTGYFGGQTYVMVEYSGPEGHGQAAAAAYGDFHAGIIYSISVVTGQIEAGSGTGGVYTLTYTAGSGGTISGEAVQVVNPGGAGTSVTAVANAGYHFVRWSDGVIHATRQDSNINNDFYCQATFASNTPPPSGGGPKPLNFMPWLLGGLVLIGSVVVVKRKKK